MCFLRVEITFKFLLNLGIFRFVTHSADIEYARLVYILILMHWLRQQEGLLFFGTCPLQKIVKDMVVSLSLSYRNDSALFQQVTNYKGAFNVCLALAIQQQNKLTKSRGVIVSDSLCVSEGFKDLIAPEDLVLDPV